MTKSGEEFNQVFLTYTVTLDKINDHANPISFDINPSGGTATLGTDYVDFTGSTVTIPVGSSYGQFSVSILDDALTEGSETVDATISNPSDPGVVISTSTATGTIVDDESPTASYDADLSVLTNGDESSGESIVYTVYLSSANTTGSPITFDIDPIGGSAVATTDYTNFAGSQITIPNGAVSGSLSIPVVDDSLWENEESVIAEISNCSEPSVTIQTSAATALIYDSDNTHGTIGVSLSVIQTGSEVGPTDIIYRLTTSVVNNTGVPVTLDFIRTGGNASNGSDYGGFSGAQFSIPDGSNQATLTMPVYDDTLFENNESITARLINPSDSALNLTTSNIYITTYITDDDNQTGSINADLTVSQNGSESGTQSLVYSVTMAKTNNTHRTIYFYFSKTGGEATAPADFQSTFWYIGIPHGSSTGSRGLSVVDDTLFENTESIEMTVNSIDDGALSMGTASATATITDNDNGAGSIAATLSASQNCDETGPQSIQYTLTLAKTNYSVNGDLTFDITATGGTATSGSDYSGLMGQSITVPFGSDVGTITVPVIDDNLFENTESIIATVSNPSDPAISLSTPSATAQISDNDNVSTSIAADLSVVTAGSENGPVDMVFKVTMSEVNHTDGPITFLLNSVGGTAISGTDYDDITDSVISIPSGSAEGTLSVAVTDDAFFENTETVEVQLSSSSDPAVYVAINSATTTITDSDNTAASIDADLSVSTHGNESGLVGVEFTVTLAVANNTGQPITFSIAPSGGSAVEGADYEDMTGFQITVPDGASSGSSTVAVLQDSLFENTETLSATISTPSDPAIVIQTDTVSGNIYDNENIAGTVPATLSQLSQGAEAGLVSIQYEVTLGFVNNTHGPITFVLDPIGGTATVGSDYTDFSGTIITIPDGSDSGTASVSVLDDSLFENNELVQAAISSPSDPAITLATATANGVIVDDDNAQG